MAESINYDVSEALRYVKVNVRLTGVKRMQLRIRFALWLIRIAILISGMGFEYEGVKPIQENET